MDFENNFKNLSENKAELLSFDYEFRHDESNEEFLNRFLKHLRDVSVKEDGDSLLGAGINLKKKKNFFTLSNSDENRSKSEKAISLVLNREIESEGKTEELAEEKNQQNFLVLQEEVSNASRDAALSDEQFTAQNYYENTNQYRNFFPDNFKKDGIPYAISLFGVGLQNSVEVEKYFKLKLDNKNICLLGGGQSCQDLVKSNLVKPKAIINIDPYIAQENIDRSSAGSYTSFNLKADDPSLEDHLKEIGISKFDEIWASYSVPFYNKNPKEIMNLFSNIKSLLSENGNCRITPLSIQEGCKEVFLDEIKKIKDSGEFNIHLMDDALIIHRIKKET